MSLQGGATPKPVHDLIVVGAGPAGLALALALGPPGLGLDCVVVAAERPAPPPAGAPGRAYALGAGSCRMLDRLGVWPAVVSRAQAMDRIIVTDGRVGGSELSLLEFGATDAADGPAYIVEEPALLAALLDAATAPPGVTFQIGEVTGFASRNGLGEIAFADGRRSRAPLIVAADGARSHLRTLNGIKLVSWDYGQAGLVANVDHDQPHNGVAIERFYPSGPFAMLPLSGNRTSLVWTEGETEAARLAAMDEAEFRAELEQRFGDDRGGITAIGPRRAYPLKFQVARKFTAGRLALVGDAAHVVHPLAGQGLNLGFRDVAALAECVADAARLGLDPGDATTLGRYERWRRFDTVQSALGFDALNRLFSNDHDGLRLVRDLGLGLVERLPAVKRVFMAEAAGLTGALPRLFAGDAL
ncbi:2-octaprenyl-6-methoxyphenol hydroxylase [hydrothermal vent metagenome]|uniref:2-octaprenyl-6-methoxyphenol hydroxylase n=1 Tax=hydrothermal vent metagenome TaxID=652676 RepID=A0A3B0TYZ2_9ZZZZ